MTDGNHVRLRLGHRLRMPRAKRALGLVVAVTVTATLTACGGSSTPASQPSMNTTSPTSPTSPASPASPTSPTSPTASTPTIRPSRPASSHTPTAITAPLVVYYIAVGDNGRGGPRIGCGDSAIATYTAPVRYTDAVGAAMRALLSNRNREIGQSGLINVLSHASLTYGGSVVRGTTVTVYLHGTFQLAGECDIPRAKAELQYTAMRAAHATRAVIYVDGQTIDQRLSLK